MEITFTVPASQADPQSLLLTGTADTTNRNFEQVLQTYGANWAKAGSDEAAGLTGVPPLGGPTEDEPASVAATEEAASQLLAAMLCGIPPALVDLSSALSIVKDCAIQETTGERAPTPLTFAIAPPTPKGCVETAKSPPGADDATSAIAADGPAMTWTMAAPGAGEPKMTHKVDMPTANPVHPNGESNISDQEATFIVQRIEKVARAEGAAMFGSPDEGVDKGSQNDLPLSDLIGSQHKVDTVKFTLEPTPAAIAQAPHAQRSAESVGLAETHATAITSRIAERIEELRAANPARTVTLRLDPPELGTIELTVRARGNRIEASVQTDNDWVRNAVHTNRANLADGLQTRGLSLETLDVRGLSQSAPQTQQHPQQGQGQQQRAAPGRMVTGSAAEAMDVIPGTRSVHFGLMDIEA